MFSTPIRRHAPDSESVVLDLPSLGASRQQNLLAAERITAKKAVWFASQRRNTRLCHDQGAPLPSSSVASAASSRSCWRLLTAAVMVRELGERQPKNRYPGMGSPRCAAPAR